MFEMWAMEEPSELQLGELSGPGFWVICCSLAPLSELLASTTQMSEL